LQRVKWLGQVAIARWDEKDHQGWKRLGIPTEMSTETGVTIDMGAVIKDGTFLNNILITLDINKLFNLSFIEWGLHHCFDFIVP
jgi:hypothetical protein